eukprot:272620-Prorocentrum_minimum.AAC.1
MAGDRAESYDHRISRCCVDPPFTRAEPPFTPPRALGGEEGRGALTTSTWAPAAATCKAVVPRPCPRPALAHAPTRSSASAS